jgi:hypothetical protein
MKDLDHFDRCFYCNHLWTSPVKEEPRCLLNKSLLTCEVWSPNKVMIVQQAKSLDLSVTDLISLIQLRGYN